MGLASGGTSGWFSRLKPNIIAIYAVSAIVVCLFLVLSVVAISGDAQVRMIDVAGNLALILIGAGLATITEFAEERPPPQMPVDTAVQILRVALGARPTGAGDDLPETPGS